MAYLFLILEQVIRLRPAGKICMYHHRLVGYFSKETSRTPERRSTMVSVLTLETDRAGETMKNFETRGFDGCTFILPMDWKKPAMDVSCSSPTNPSAQRLLPNGGSQTQPDLG